MKATNALRLSLTLILAHSAVANILSVVNELGSGYTILQSLLAINDPALTPITERLSSIRFATLFAPTDAAFNKLPVSTLAFLQSSPEALAEVLSYHVVETRFRFRRVPDKLLDTLQGNALFVANQDFGFGCYFGFCNNEKLSVNTAGVVSTNTLASNGLIHGIDKVLIPPGVVVFDVLQTNGPDSTLVVASEAAGLDAALGEAGPFTLFAPTDEAFSSLPIGYVNTLLMPENVATLETILLYHVVQNTALSADAFVNGDKFLAANGEELLVIVEGTDIRIRDATSGTASVVDSDISAINGVVHTIDKVLLPASIELPKQTGLIQILSQDSELSTFVDMLSKQPSILDIISRDVPLTVFAPTNTAFESFTLPGFASEEDVLLYHIGGQQLTKQNLIDFTILNIPTYQGTGLDSTFNSAGDVFVEGAKIIEADIMATNGIIHKIDTVLIPPDPRDIFFCPLPDFLCDFFEVAVEELIKNVIADPVNDILNFIF